LHFAKKPGTSVFMRFTASILLLLLLLLPAQWGLAEPLRIATSLPVSADWAREIGGSRVEVVSLAPPGADPHAWQPAPSDMLKLRRANLIFGISPDMEGWFAKLVSTGELRRKTVWLEPENATPRPAGASAPARDPHLWLDIELAATMCSRIAEVLGRADTAGAKAYADAAGEYTASLHKLDSEARKFLATVPPERRVLFSRHDNLSRIALRYGLRTEATLSGSASAESPDPSAKRLAAFIRLARKTGTPVFYDGDAPGALVESITRDAALPPPVRLYLETLLPPPHPASTYRGMFRENIRLIGTALGATEKFKSHDNANNDNAAGH
jgi:zinc/manganese transport system substrate-binding protein